MKRTFDKSRVALAEYDRTAPARTEAWERAETVEDIDRAEAADKAALAAVRYAFWEDTQDINSRNNCDCVDMAFVRKMVNSK